MGNELKLCIFLQFIEIQDIMSKAISAAVRRSLVEERGRGATLQELAAAHGISYGSVQQICARHRSEGEAGLRPRYDRCGKPRRSDADFAFRAARCLKTWHPSWGAPKIRAEILLRCPGLEMPSIRAMQKWFRHSGLSKSRNRPPQEEKQWAKSAHEVWQIDAKEEMATMNNQKNCWLNIKDEFTGAVLDPWVFPPQKDLRGTLNQGSTCDA